MRSLMRQVAVLIVVAAVPCAAQSTAPTTSRHIESSLEPLPLDALRHLDTKTPDILDTMDARAILDSTLVPATASKAIKALPDDKDFYCIIHLLKWNISDNADPQHASEGTKKAEPSTTDRWFVYHGGRWSRDDFSANNRVFGASRIWLLFIHLYRPQAAYVARYQFDTTKKTPAFLSDLAGVAQMFFTPGGSPVVNSWGGGYVDVEDVPSDVTIRPLKVDDQLTTRQFSKLAEPKTFDNEGRYWIDFSVGVPIKAGKEVQIDASTGVLTPRTVDRQNIFGLVNIFFQPVDVKNMGFNRIPHLVAGVAIASQPLHKILLAVGWGPAFAHFYVGTLIAKQPQPKPGMPEEYEAQFAFGLNLTVKGTQEALKKGQK